jgi:eukaryotic-like serine/threonine-protein kinase
VLCAGGELGCMSRDREPRGLLPSTEREKQVPQVASAAQTDVPGAGQVIAGKYQVDRVVGAGGMGVVLAAHHLQLQQRVAIKFMRAQAARDPNAVERFLREARAAAALSSDHVARVLDVGMLEGGEPYMVMEFLHGVDLARVVEQHGPMPVADAVGYLLEACEAIAEAHSSGIVHRDLKPANLFLNKRRDGSSIIKVLDFGISKVADFNTTTSANLTASGLVMGSPGYMSPEQVRNAKGVDTRADVWALGVILFELVTGARPFAGETVGEVLALILSEPPPSARQYRPDVPEGVAAIIGRCLDRHVERRIQSVGELAAQLVPFGPPSARGSLERILRWRSQTEAASSRGQASSRAQTQTAIASGAPAETGPPWLRSGSSEPPTRRAGRWPAVALIAGGAAAAGGVGVYALFGRTAPSDVHGAVAPSVSPGVAMRSAPMPTETPASAVLAAPPTPTEPVRTGPADAGLSRLPETLSTATSVPPARRVLRPAPTRPAAAPSTTPTNNEKDLY